MNLRKPLSFNEKSHPEGSFFCDFDATSRLNDVINYVSLIRLTTQECRNLDPFLLWVCFSRWLFMQRCDAWLWPRRLRSFASRRSACHPVDQGVDAKAWLVAFGGRGRTFSRCCNRCCAATSGCTVNSGLQARHGFWARLARCARCDIGGLRRFRSRCGLRTVGRRRQIISKRFLNVRKVVLYRLYRAIVIHACEQ